ncbi:hypothetical protein H4R34_003297 [Dimargaris verticillata]|uniref:Uncharacterized protein n=1 Tax=Dimargaris verticillata TaxID=2761393 RepID=A0A9W8B759_9FUNG|nr:hypothetical protein H4R34_003297 [Dimargaris verticillata]
MRGVLLLALAAALASTVPAEVLHWREWFSFLNPTSPIQRTTAAVEEYNAKWKLPAAPNPLTGGLAQLCYSGFSWRYPDYHRSAARVLKPENDKTQRCLPFLSQFPINVRVKIAKYALDIFKVLRRFPPVAEDTSNAIKRKVAYDNVHIDTYKGSNHVALYIEGNQIAVQAINLVKMPAYLGTKIVVLPTLPKNAYCIAYEDTDESMHAAMEYFARVFTDGFNGLTSEERDDVLKFGFSTQ